MKAALTIWGKRISPVFDSAQTILVADIDEGTIAERQLFEFEAEHPEKLAKQLKRQGVSVFICGAITEYPARVLESETLKLIPFVSGNAEAVLQTLAEGNPIVPLFLMPGCKARNLMCRQRKMRCNEFKKA